jgi:hypothetical protein
MNKYSLFIDELGIANPKATESKLYVLTGIAVKKDFKDQLKIEADQIKFKYWNKTDIVFHSRQIGKNLSDFEIFKDKNDLKSPFINDLLNYLAKIPITIFSVVVDKDLALKNNWNDIKILRETIRLLYFNFLTFLLGKDNGKGKIVVESATAEKDVYYLKYFAYFTSPNCKELNIDYKKVQNILTSISFVTKRNFDIEEQIADLFSYAGKCKYMKDFKNKSYTSDSYESKIIKILNNKLFSKPKNLSAKKLKFYEKAEPFVVLPK